MDLATVVVVNVVRLSFSENIANVSQRVAKSKMENFAEVKICYL